MISSFYTAASGAIWLQKGIDVTANNVANISTNGYKADKVSFSDLVYTNVYPKGENDKLKMGNGVKLDKIDTVFTDGPINPTGRPLDFALQSDGFFAVQTPSGVKYTRDGNFTLSEENGQSFLTTPSGDYVLNSQGQRIAVNDDQQNLDIGVFKFQNTDGLVKDGNDYIVPTTNAGTVSVVQDPIIRQGALEGSSVNLADEMTDIINSQRSFQFNTKIVQISDEIMQTINGLR
ncbi:MAG TPA: flagellar hook-basal body protein [Oscillospiraceae bacterium]|nr:flagellar hook-basal body protein [Oscillospiraceae bacterium]